MTTETANVDVTLTYIEQTAKFKKRAESALNRKVLDGLKQLGRCANPRIYAYTDEQVETILTQIDNGVADLKRAFKEAGGEGRKWVEL